jgi:hypothetical protein
MPSNTTQIKHRQWLQVRRLMGAIVITVVSLVWWSGYALNGIATMVHRRASRLRTGSNISHATRACRSTIVDESCAHNRVSVCYGREATRRLSTAGKRRRQAPCQDTNRYGDMLAADQGGPRDFNPRWAPGGASWKAVQHTTVRRSTPGQRWCSGQEGATTSPCDRSRTGAS